MKVYIAGKITGNPNYKEQFAEAEKLLRAEGHTVMNPTILPPGFEHEEYLRINFSMIDVCEGMYFLNNWANSFGARIEHQYGMLNKKILMFQSKCGVTITFSERQVPIKPIKMIADKDIKIGSVVWRKGTTVFNCACGNLIGFKQSFCDKCGQKQYWD